MRIHFVLVGEGRSEEGLIPHIERLLIQQGVEEVTATAPDFGLFPKNVGHSVMAKLRVAVQLEAAANLFIIHRDADDRNPNARYEEIAHAVQTLTLERPWVAVVPVQETESWLLLDEAAIRSVAGNPNGTVQLRLPMPAQVEHRANPKEVLAEALLAASQLTGRRAQKFRSRKSAMRKQLLEQLPVGGLLESVASWCRFRDDLAEAIRGMELIR